jgi:hypothetical protein
VGEQSTSGRVSVGNEVVSVRQQAGSLKMCGLVQCKEKISAVQPIGVSELQQVVDRTRDEDFTCAVVQQVPAVQRSATRSN